MQTETNTLRISSKGQVMLATPKGSWSGEWKNGNELHCFGTSKVICFNERVADEANAAIIAYVPAEYMQIKNAEYIGTTDDATPDYDTKLVLVPGTGEAIIIEFAKTDVLA